MVSSITFAQVRLAFHRVTGLIRDVASHTGSDTGAPGFLQWQMTVPFGVAPEVQGPLEHHFGV